MTKLARKKEKCVFIVDSREKKSLWQPGEYPDFDVECSGLKTGDYSIKGMEHLITIERKAGVHELYINMTSGRRRFYDEIKRMEDIPLAFIVIESDMSTFMNPMSYRYAKDKRKAMEVVMSSLTGIMMLDGVHVLFVGKNSRSIVKHLLLKAFEYHQKGFFDDESETTKKKT